MNNTETLNLLLAAKRIIERRRELEFRWTERQQQALDKIDLIRTVRAAPVILYGGAFGGGKSYFGCAYGVWLCEQIPGNRGYMCRKESVVFKRTTLQTLLERVDILSRPGWQHHISEQYFSHANGSRIDYGGLGDHKDREKVKSMELGFLFVDEASEVEQLSAKMAIARVGRIPAADGNYVTILASNPEQCWLIPAFIETPSPGHGYVPALPTDNPHLSDDYIESVREIYADTPELLAAYLEGDWNAVGSVDQVFDFADVDAAMRRSMPASGPNVEYGVDVARFGDDETVIFRRQGLNIQLLARKQKLDTMQTADLIRSHVAADVVVRAIKVDDVGLGGGVTDRLGQLDLPVVGVICNAKADDPVKFWDKKAEMTWHLRELLHTEAVDLPDDAELRRQLLAIKYRVRNGRIQIEPKEEIKKRMGRSPDLFDALVLSTALSGIGAAFDLQPLRSADRRTRPQTAKLRGKTF